MIKHVSILKDEYTVEFECKGHYLNFKVYEITGEDSNGSLLYGQDHDVDYLKSGVYIDGNIKWDGCSDINLGSKHFCGKWNATNFGKLLDFIYDEGALLLKVKEQGNESLYYS